MRATVKISPVLDNGQKLTLDLDVTFKSTPTGLKFIDSEYDEAGIGFDDMLSLDSWIAINKDIILNLINVQVYE
jgi:hypothetical protein